MYPLILAYEKKYPRIDGSVMIAPNATITGDVIIEEQANIWFNTVIRGDVNTIVIGKRCNIQDGVIIHSTRGRMDTILGVDTSVGHGAILHGCRTEGRSLIGMGATILDDAIIESNVIIGANALVPMGMRCKSGFIYGGIPAKIIKPIDTENVDFYIEETSRAYIKYAGNYDSFKSWNYKYKSART